MIEQAAMLRGQSLKGIAAADYNAPPGPLGAPWRSRPTYAALPPDGGEIITGFGGRKIMPARRLSLLLRKKPVSWGLRLAI